MSGVRDFERNLLPTWFFSTLLGKYAVRNVSKAIGNDNNSKAFKVSPSFLQNCKFKKRNVSQS